MIHLGMAQSASGGLVGPTIRSYSEWNDCGAASTTHDVTMPGTIVAGDWLYAIVTTQSYQPTVSDSSWALAGWKVFSSATQYHYIRVATGSDSLQLTTTNNDEYTAIVFAISGADSIALYVSSIATQNPTAPTALGYESVGALGITAASNESQLFPAAGPVGYSSIIDERSTSNGANGTFAVYGTNLNGYTWSPGGWTSITARDWVLATALLFTTQRANKTYDTLLDNASAVFYCPLDSLRKPSIETRGLIFGLWDEAYPPVAGEDGPSTDPAGLNYSLFIEDRPLYFVYKAYLPTALGSIGETAGAFTVGGWIKTTVAGGVGNNWYHSQVMIQLRQQISETTTKVAFNLGVASSGKLGFGHSSNGSTTDEKFAATTLAAINDGNWHFVAVTRSGSTLTFYVDDTDEATTCTDFGASCGTSGLCNLWLGTAANYLGSAPVASCDGSYAGWFVVPSALSSTDLENLFNAGLAI